MTPRSDPHTPLQEALARVRALAHGLREALVLLEGARLTEKETTRVNSLRQLLTTHGASPRTADLARAGAVDPHTEAIRETCREWLEDDRCNAPAEFILWGKLFAPEALGPRCYDHATKHAGHRALGDPAWAIFDLRNVAALESERDAMVQRIGEHHAAREQAIVEKAAAEARVTQLEEDVRPLVEASVEAFGAFDGDWDDEEDVSTPGTGITFGMIRRARSALGVVADGGGGRDE